MPEGLLLLLVSRVQLFATLWTVARQALLSMEFSRQEYRSGLPFPSPGDLPNPGIEPWSPALQADSLPSEPQGSPECSPDLLCWLLCTPKEGFMGKQEGRQGQENKQNTEC